MTLADLLHEEWPKVCLIDDVVLKKNNCNLDCMCACVFNRKDRSWYYDNKGQGMQEDDINFKTFLLSLSSFDKLHRF